MFAQDVIEDSRAERKWLGYIKEDDSGGARPKACIQPAVYCVMRRTQLQLRYL